MDNNTTTPSKNTTAFYAQSAIAFGLALFTMLAAIYYLPGEAWPKAFLALGTVFLTTSAFSLAKCVRDAQESQYVVSRLDQARVDRILADHNPWKEVS
ncbi:MAG: YiaA/YiaB family inner membrane protein [Nocardioides sp.]